MVGGFLFIRIFFWFVGERFFLMVVWGYFMIFFFIRFFGD